MKHLYRTNLHVYSLLLRLSTDARESINKVSQNDGVQIFSQLDIPVCCQYMFLSLRNMFEFLGHNQFLEICAASKEIVLFHDHGLVLFRLACGLN